MSQRRSPRQNSGQSRRSFSIGLGRQDNRPQLSGSRWAPQNLAPFSNTPPAPSPCSQAPPFSPAPRPFYPTSQPTGMSETQRNQVGALNTIAVEQLYRVRSILLGSELVRPQNGWKDVALCQDILETLGNLLDGGSHPGTTTRRSIPFETARDDLKGMGDDIYVALNDLVFYAEEMQGMKEQMALVEGGLREWICQLERGKECCRRSWERRRGC